MDTKRKLSFLLIVLASFIFVCEGEERDVYLHIIDKYDKRIRPVRHTNTTTYVGTQMQIYNILEVNGQQEYIKMAVFFRLNWTDEFLTWNPEDFGGTDSIRVLADDIWIPDIAIVTTSLEAGYFFPKEDLMVLVHYTGRVDYSFPMVLSNYCPMQDEEFPFDSQTCDVKLSSWRYTTKFVVLEYIPLNNTLPRNPNTEWNVLPYTNKSIDQLREGMGEDGLYRNIWYSVRIQRKTAYYIWVIIVPTFIISALNIAGIFTPFSSTGQREEKVTLGLTTLLTLSIILSLVTGAMPKGTKLPILGMFLLLNLLTCTLTTAVSSVISYLHERAITRSWPIPERLMFCFKSENRTGGTECGGNLDTYYGKRQATQVKQNNNPQINANMAPLESTLIEVKMWLRKTDEEEERRKKWTIIFDRVDTTCFVFFQLVNIASFVIII